MKETELLYYFPYKIEKESNFRYYADDYGSSFLRRHVPNYDGTNVFEFLYNKSGLSKKEIYDFHYLYENFRNWENWYKNGKNIFSFSKELLSMLKKTDVDDIKPDSFHLPYDIFYISLKPLNIKIAEGREEIIEGVYVDHNIWDPNGEHPEGYCDLSFYFVGDFKKLFLKYVPHVKGRMPVTINNEVTYDEWQEGSFWNVCLSFHKRDGRETVKQTIDFYLHEQKEYILSNEDETAEPSKFETDYYNSAIILLKNTISLVINCLLYLSLATEKIDIEKKYPENLPHNFNKKLKFSKNSKEQEKVSKKIDQLGFSKINYIGQSYKRDYPSIFPNTIQQPHWRRGHWRNQRFGEKLKDKKLIWIQPTIVGKNTNLPLQGHVYDIKDSNK
jgi:hypothetical protein